tara:strand:+ start:2282 stop:2470 length:189 start_codon:yes stop_codon:yes gene_type:complete
MVKHSSFCYFKISFIHLSRSLWFAKGATGAGCGVFVERMGLQERHLYSSTIFKINRAAALGE